MKYPYNPSPEQMQKYREHIDACLIRWIAKTFSRNNPSHEFFRHLQRNTGREYAQRIRSEVVKIWRK